MADNSYLIAVDKKKIDDFCNLAEEYCGYITGKEITIDAIPYLIELLMKLYVSAQNLPDCGQWIEDSSLSLSSVENIEIRISEQIPADYWEEFDPGVCEDPVAGNLRDDLTDIASDLKRGISEYHLEKYSNAAFEWQLGLDTHWGQHAVDAIRALHSIRIK